MKNPDVKKVAVLLPAYNEELTVVPTIESFHRALPDAEIVVIDNRSSDRTAQVAEECIRRLGCSGRVLREPRPGKGNAIRKAFCEISADIYVMTDADTTYSATDLPRLMAPVLEGRADVVVGDRHANAVYKQQNERLFHNFGNGLVRRLINLLFGTSLNDIMSGYRVLSYRFVKNFPVLSEGFELETEMTLHAVDKRFALAELPIQYLTRPAGSFSKLNTLRDGMRVLKMILWIFKDYRPLIFFTLLSFICALVGLGIGLPVVFEFMHTGLVPKFPSAILASALMSLGAVFFATGLILDTVAKFHRADFEIRLAQRFPGAFRP